VKVESIVLGEERAQALARYPHAKRVGDFLFLSGVSSRRADNTHAGVIIHDDGRVEKDIAAQTQGVIENMRAILQTAGLDLKDLVDVTTFLVEMQDFSGYNEIYNRYFEKNTGPARTTVAVSGLPHANLLVEMKGIAVFSSP
jgi:2-aminomuconate deaminase